MTDPNAIASMDEETRARRHDRFLKYLLLAQSMRELWGKILILLVTRTDDPAETLRKMQRIVFGGITLDEYTDLPYPEELTVEKINGMDLSKLELLAKAYRSGEDFSYEIAYTLCRRLIEASIRPSQGLLARVEGDTKKYFAESSDLNWRGFPYYDKLPEFRLNP